MFRCSTSKRIQLHIIQGLQTVIVCDAVLKGCTLALVEARLKQQEYIYRCKTLLWGGGGYRYSGERIAFCC